MSQAPARAEATGQLGATPLGDVLISLLDRRLTGSLVIEEPGGAKSAFTVSSGAIVKGRTPEPVIRLGELLIARGLLGADELQSALTAATQRRTLLGAALVESGAVRSDTLEAALSEQLARRFLWACALPDQTVFGFYPGVDFLSAWGGGKVALEPLALIWRSTREHAHPRRVETLLGRLASRRLALHPLARPDRFGLSADEAALVEALRAGAHSLESLLSRASALGARAGALVYALALTRHIDLGDGRDPLGVDAHPSDPTQLRTGVRAREQSGSGAETGSRVAGGTTSDRPGETWPNALFPSRSDISSSPSDRPSAAGWSTTPRGLAASEDRASRVTDRPSDASSTGPRPAGVVADAGNSWLTGPRPASSRPPGSRSSTPSSRPGARLPSPPPSSRPPELVLNELLEREIVQRAAQLTQLDHYQALGIDRAATAERIHTAYLQQVKRWHPDRLPSSLAHRRHEAARVFARVNEAHRVLSDPEERVRYEAELGSGESEEATVERVLAAAEHFRRAELLAKRSDFAAALRHAEAAYQGDPDSEEHGALYAYLTARSDERLDGKRLSELSGLVERAVKRDAENARWLYYRGCVSQRAGRIEEAMRDFRVVLRLDPNHIDAARELRLYNIRKERTSDRPGLLGHLFGRQQRGSQPPRGSTSKSPPAKKK